MMAANGNDNNNIIRGIYTGNEIPVIRVIQAAFGEMVMEFILQDITHLTVDRSITVIPAERFLYHRNIVELICHENVVKIEKKAFHKCPRLRRVVLRGVEVAEVGAFNGCKSLEYVECNELKILGECEFGGCISLRDIILPSATIVKQWAFGECKAIEDVKFGPSLESIGGLAFKSCPSLQRITIPLKNNLFPYDNTFSGCENLRAVHIVEEEVLKETVSALLWDEWQNDMRREIDSINHNLPNAPAGDWDDVGEKAIVLREWISSVLSKVIHYKAQHRQILNEAASTLELLPKDIVLNNVLSFIELPSYTFDGEEDDEGLEG